MKRVCSVTECGRPHTAQGYCAAHYQRWAKGKPVTDTPIGHADRHRRCKVDGCEDAHHAKGYCRLHYKRWLYEGDVGPLGGKRPYGHITKAGYRRIGHKFEHVLVMEAILGRPLRPKENVHHINGQRDDNRPENLELWSTSQPAGQSVDDKLQWARELIGLYRPEWLRPE
jgi:hypothetical protein